MAEAAVAVSAAPVEAALGSDMPGEAPQAKVGRLIIAGAAAMRDNKYNDAEVLFKQAYAIEERADVLYYLCVTDMMRGRCRDARATGAGQSEVARRPNRQGRSRYQPPHPP